MSTDLNDDEDNNSWMSLWLLWRYIDKNETIQIDGSIPSRSNLRGEKITTYESKRLLVIGTGRDRMTREKSGCVYFEVKTVYSVLSVAIGMTTASIFNF